MGKFGNSIEEMCIRKIEGGIRAVKNGTKTPRDTRCNYYLDKLKSSNIPMYEDLNKKYVQAVLNSKD